MSETALQACIAKAICKSGKFETGNGTCALTCMDQLGDARQNCRHAERIHDKLAEQIASAIAAWNARPGDAARETAITEAIQALIDASDYFSARADVNDGDYGVPSPNREMTLASQCDEALERLEALRTHGSQP